VFLSWEEMDVLFDEDVVKRIWVRMEGCCAGCIA